jgi:EAL domain-containing protein (putative c-di-GMP-specific phosphodiesterase class I)
VWVFNDDLRAAAAARLKIEGELRHALEREELQVWYQPEVDLRTGRVTAVEALLRWKHPDGTLVTADRFVDVAEETGLIGPIGGWVFRQACDQAARWDRELGRPIPVRVNLAALQLEEAGLLPMVDAALAESGARPDLLCAEITETVWLRGTEAVRDNLDGLRDRGIAIAIDDFGTGYASLTYLRQYPVSVLKIDRSFVAAIDTDERDERLVAGLIALAEAVGVQVTAEGVETARQARVLRKLGCPTSQGFLFSRAVPADQLEILLDVTFPLG